MHAIKMFCLRTRVQTSTNGPRAPAGPRDEMAWLERRLPPTHDREDPRANTDARLVLTKAVDTDMRCSVRHKDIVHGGYREYIERRHYCASRQRHAILLQHNTHLDLGRPS